MRAIFSWLAGFVVFCATTAFAADPIRIEAEHVQIRRGEMLDLACEWLRPESVSVAGTFQAWCRLVDRSDRTIAWSRRQLRVTLHEAGERPYRFRVRIRVPRGVERGVRADVLVHGGMASDRDAFASYEVLAHGSIPLFENEGRRPFRFERYRRDLGGPMTVTGVLRRGGGGLPEIVVEYQVNGGHPLPLYGTGAGMILDHPAWAGATVTVEGTVLRWGGIYFDVPPGVMFVDRLEWRDPAPGPVHLPAPFRLVEGELLSRIPPAELTANPLAWRELLAATRQPRIVTDEAGRDALVQALRSAASGLTASNPKALAPLESLDVTLYDAVCVFTGTTPNHGWGLTATRVDRDDSAQRTFLRYTVAGPWSNADFAPELSDAFAVYLLPKLPGSIEVLRDEWTPDRPLWW